jgi:arylsulfatase
MKNRAFSSIAVSIAIGAFFGWLAAKSRLSPILRADVGPITAQTEPRPSGSAASAENLGICTQNLSKRQMLALATNNRATAANTAQSAKKPNILVIFGDDIGQTNVSAYSMGLMGYRTPNIDHIAREGMIFTDCYAEQICTAGRSSFITGQCTLRTGLSKVGAPGATVGLQARDATIAELLKPLGYATGQFGKNHLGDRNEYLPTVHGFDEFFGNLYHLNAEEDPEDFNYPRDPRFKERFGPRGVLRCRATDVDDPTDQPRWGRVGKQTI